MKNTLAQSCACRFSVREGGLPAPRLQQATRVSPVAVSIPDQPQDDGTPASVDLSELEKHLKQGIALSEYLAKLYSATQARRAEQRQLAREQAVATENQQGSASTIQYVGVCVCVCVCVDFKNISSLIVYFFRYQ